MRLLMDIGNTRLKWAVQTEHGVGAQQAYALAELDDARLQELLSACGAVTQVCIANVAGAIWQQRLTQAVTACWQLMPCFVTATTQATVNDRVIRNAYREPHKLGVDRWLALLAVAQMSSAAALVVSAGTALTIDALLPNGQHAGGLIVPGVNLMMRSLLQDTSDIAAHATDDELNAQSWFADNTLSCVHFGAQHAAVAVIEAAHRQLCTLSAQPPVAVQVYLTGGAASVLQAALSVPTHYMPDLVLRGLALM